jgi:hypothetical protein
MFIPQMCHRGTERGSRRRCSDAERRHVEDAMVCAMSGSAHIARKSSGLSRGGCYRRAFVSRRRQSRHRRHSGTDSLTSHRRPDDNQAGNGPDRPTGGV